MDTNSILILLGIAGVIAGFHINKNTVYPLLNIWLPLGSMVVVMVFFACEWTNWFFLILATLAYLAISFLISLVAYNKHPSDGKEDKGRLAL